MSFSNNYDEYDLRPKLCVFGVGGAGGNAINNIIKENLNDVVCYAANTDAQALKNSLAPEGHRIQLGVESTRGLGAGSNPAVGRIAAEESLKEISEALKGCNMVFITAGMGGGTGTGASPVIAKAAKDLGILTVGVVTKPFFFEGKRRNVVAEEGIEEMYACCDVLIIIPNQNLFRIVNEKTTFAEAFRMADEVLLLGVHGIVDLIVRPGLVNLDFADIRAVFSNYGGKAMMGTGEAEGENKAIRAAEAAISNALLDSSSMKGAKGVIINITGGSGMTLFDVEAAVERIKDEVDPNANIIFGTAYDPDAGDLLKVSVIATGIESSAAAGSEDFRSHRNEAKKSPVTVKTEDDAVPDKITRIEREAPAEVEVTAHHANNTEDEFDEWSQAATRDSGVFIAPAPQEPRSQPFIANDDNNVYKDDKVDGDGGFKRYIGPGSAEDDEENNSNSNASSPATNNKTSTFGRVAAIFGRSKNNAEKKPVDTNEDIADVPTFMRRNRRLNSD